ncbi:hypothetical protein MFIFM68171_10196 [Madurella fahalii]|uniref:Uncharacterized protein n=1 Tax=Madurella fahalii TaxID=1157608 RepID=A0ABQ0GQH2_9PEZI
MFISLTAPPVDVVFPGDNVFTSAAAAACAPWPFCLNRLGAARILHQHRLHDMSFNPALLRSGLSDADLKRQRQQQQQALPVYGNGCYQAELQKAGENALLPVRYHTRVSIV